MCKAIFMITSSANIHVSFFCFLCFAVHRRAHKRLRLAMKVDEHKYYDGFLGAINDAFDWCSREILSRSRREKRKRHEEPLSLGSPHNRRRSCYSQQVTPNGWGDGENSDFCSVPKRYSHEWLHLPVSHCTSRSPMTSLRSTLAAL